MCYSLMYKTYAKKNQLQKLLGNLIHIGRCLRPAWLFTHRVLALLRQAAHTGHIRLNNVCFKYLCLFMKFVELFNGSLEIHTTQVISTSVYVAI